MQRSRHALLSLLLATASRRTSDLSPTASVRQRFRHLRLSTWLSLATVAIAFCQTVTGWHRMNPDGISYLDVATMYLRGEWAAALNPYWSPLYSWILGLGLFFSQPTGSASFQVVHLINFAILCGTLVAFNFFVRSLHALRHAHHHPGSDPATSRPDRVLTALAFAVFLWYVLRMVPVWLVTPDLLVTGLVFAAAGLFARGLAEPRGAAHHLLLGSVLGAAYLAKTALFLVGLMFVIAVFAADPKLRTGGRRAGLTLAAFLLISMPFVGLLSQRQGYLTIGESGRMNYAWAVNHTGGTLFREQTSQARGSVVSIRQVYASPGTFTFSGSLTGTFPPWYNPAQWYTQAAPRIEPLKQLRTVRRNTAIYVELLTYPLVVLLVVLFAGGRRITGWREAKPYVLIMVPMAGALGMYALVHVEPRYVSCFLAVLLLTAFVGLSAQGRRGSRIVRPAALALTCLFGLLGVDRLGKDILLARAQRPALQPWHVAAGAQRIVPIDGAGIAVIGNEREVVYWAHLARAQIVAAVPEREKARFWEIGSAERQEVLACMAVTGAVAAATQGLPDAIPGEGWQRIGDTSHYLYDLRRVSRSCPTAARS